MASSKRFSATTAATLVVIAVGIYVGFAFGSVYWYKYRVSDVMQRELAFAGQRTAEAIRGQIVNGIAELNVPPQARSVRLSASSSPRSLQATTSYVDTVNLIVTKRMIPVTVEVRRIY